MARKNDVQSKLENIYNIYIYICVKFFIYIYKNYIYMYKIIYLCEKLKCLGFSLQLFSKYRVRHV